MFRRLIWWWQDRPYMNLNIGDLEVADDVILNLPRLELTPKTTGATTTVNF